MTDSKPLTGDALLYLEMDGELDASEERLLQEHLSAEPDAVALQKELEELRTGLEASRVAVRSDFQASVMEALPSAAWEVRAPRQWVVPLALAAFLATAAALLALGNDWSGVPVLGTFDAIVDLFAASAVAGAGLLGATWTGLRLSVLELFEGSWATPIAFGALVLGVNLLLFRRLRRRAPETTAGGQRDDRQTPRT